MLMRAGTGVGPADVLLDADLGGLVPIALAQLMPNTLQRMRRGALRAYLLLLGQIVLDGDARKVLRDRLASASMFSLVLFDLRGALAMGFLGSGNGCQHLRFIEQHR